MSKKTENAKTTQAATTPASTGKSPSSGTPATTTPSIPAAPTSEIAAATSEEGEDAGKLWKDRPISMDQSTTMSRGFSIGGIALDGSEKGLGYRAFVPGVDAIEAKAEPVKYGEPLNIHTLAHKRLADLGVTQGNASSAINSARNKQNQSKSAEQRLRAIWDYLYEGVENGGAIKADLEAQCGFDRKAGAVGTTEKPTSPTLTGAALLRQQAMEAYKRGDKAEFARLDQEADDYEAFLADRARKDTAASE